MQRETKPKHSGRKQHKQALPDASSHTGKRTTLAEKIACSLRNHPDWTIHKIAKNHRGADVEMVRRIKGGKGVAEVESIGTITGKTMADFRERFDSKHIIQKAVAKYLGANGKHYYTDHEFRDLCGIHPQQWRRYSEDEEFDAYRLRRAHHNLWAPTKMIQQMKQILCII